MVSMQVTIHTGQTSPLGGGAHLSQYGDLTQIAYSTRYETGFAGEDQASWTIAPNARFYAGIAKPGTPVSIMVGGATCWVGQLQEMVPQPDGDLEFTARGFAYDLYDYLAIYFDSVPLGPDLWHPTTDIALGWQFVLDTEPSFLIRTAAIPTGQIGDSPIAEKFLTLGELLTAVCVADNVKWAVWGQTLYIAADPTVATWSYQPREAIVGVIDSEYVTKLYGWYLAVDPPTTQTDYQITSAVDPNAGDFDPRIRGVDLRPLGLMTSGQAVTFLQGLLEQVKGRYLFSDGFTFSVDMREQGTGMTLPQLVRAGTKVKIPEMRNSMGRFMKDGANEFIIGRTEFSWSAASEVAAVTCTPMGAVPRDLSSVLATPDRPDPISNVAVR